MTIYSRNWGLVPSCACLIGPSEMGARTTQLGLYSLNSDLPRDTVNIDLLFVNDYYTSVNRYRRHPTLFKSTAIGSFACLAGTSESGKVSECVVIDLWCV